MKLVITSHMFYSNGKTSVDLAPGSIVSSDEVKRIFGRTQYVRMLESGLLVSRMMLMSWPDLKPWYDDLMKEIGGP